MSTHFNSLPEELLLEIILYVDSTGTFDNLIKVLGHSNSIILYRKIIRFIFKKHSLEYNKYVHSIIGAMDLEELKGVILYRLNIID